MRRAPAVVIAGAAGFAGIVAMHAGRAPSFLSGTGPPAPVRSSPTTTGPSTTPAVSPTGAAATALGTSEQYGYGVLAVKVTVRGSRITDVSVARLQTAEQYSQRLAQQVIPVLRNEVLSAQSTHINGISGATYTSEAYAYSVQSALDLLGVK
ncbi:MAG: FMN-binding protein [Acidimicrobiales bacterium]